MKHRILAAAAIAWLLWIPAAGQGPSTTAPQEATAARAWTPLRTVWGDPDLQGIWNNKTMTPFERPAELASREFFTDEEIAARGSFQKAPK